MNNELTVFIPSIVPIIAEQQTVVMPVPDIPNFTQVPVEDMSTGQFFLALTGLTVRHNVVPQFREWLGAYGHCAWTSEDRYAAISFLVSLFQEGEIPEIEDLRTKLHERLRKTDA
jgi:hypothetical protein